MADHYDFVASQTSAILREVYQVRFAPLAMGNVGFAPSPEDFDNFVPGAKEIVMRATEDLDPGDESEVNAQGTIFFRVGTKGAGETVNVRTWVAISQYTDDEVRQSRLLNRDLPAEQISAGIRAGARRHDKLAFSGGPESKSSFANHGAGTGNNQVRNTTGLSDWDDAATAASTIYNEVVSLVTKPSTQTAGEFPCTHLRIPLSAYNNMSGKRLGANGEGQTILQAVRDAFGIDIAPIFQLSSVITNGRAVAYNNSPEVGKNLLLMPETPGDPLRVHGAYEVGTEVKSAGFYWMNTAAVHYGDDCLA